ncbi:4-coumarate--CoA ligase 6-like protein, partial [Tanacetum coccineum]
YGMSESTVVGTRGFNTRHKKNYSYVGLLAPNMQAKVVDCVNGSSWPPKVTGELWLRGPAIMKGTSVVVDIRVSYLQIKTGSKQLDHYNDL